MIITHEDKLAVLTEYRRRREGGVYGPREAIRAVQEAYAYPIMARLLMGRMPDLADVARWTAADAYRDSMRRRGSWWVQ